MIPIRIKYDASRCAPNALFGSDANAYLRFKTRYMWYVNEIGIWLTIGVVLIVVLLIFGGSKGKKDGDFDRDADDRFGNAF